MDVSNRQRMILAAVVALNEKSGDPVGSKLLTEVLSQLSVSSATLRSEMSTLTNMGYLMQPHTSAGRVPTPQGFRYYLDHLMQYYPLTDREKMDMHNTAMSLDPDPEKAAKQVVKYLSDKFSLACVIATPKSDDARVVHFKVLKAGIYNAAVIGITSTGSVQSSMCRMSWKISDDEINDLEKFLNSSLAFVYAQDIPDALPREILEMKAKGFDYSPAYVAAVNMIRSATEVKVFSDGLENLLRFEDLDVYARELIQLVTSTSEIRRLVENIRADSRVLVGDELDIGDIDRLGLVAAPYKAGGGRKGGVGILGPIRMNYAFIIPRLCYFCEEISKATV